MEKVLNIGAIEKKFPHSFYPLDSLRISSDWEKKNIASIRCSVFSFFLSSVSELEEYIDKASEIEKNKYRQSFLFLINTILFQTTVYKKQKRDKNLYLLSSINIEDIVELTEISKCDLFLPEDKLIFYGHDDFGFIILYDQTLMIPLHITDAIHRANLFLVHPPK